VGGRNRRRQGPPGFLVLRRPGGAACRAHYETILGGAEQAKSLDLLSLPSAAGTSASSGPADPSARRQGCWATKLSTSPDRSWPHSRRPHLTARARRAAKAIGKAKTSLPCSLSRRNHCQPRATHSCTRS